MIKKLCSETVVAIAGAGVAMRKNGISARRAKNSTPGRLQHHHAIAEVPRRRTQGPKYPSGRRNRLPVGG